MSELIRVYADYTGCGVSSPELRETASNLILSQPLYGNPHSAHALGLQASADINSARGSMLTYFDAWEEYDVIFTSGATTALRVAQEIFASLPVRKMNTNNKSNKNEKQNNTKQTQKKQQQQQQQQDSSSCSVGKKTNNDDNEEDLASSCARPSNDPRNEKYRQKMVFLCHWAAHTSLIGIRAHHQCVKFRGFRHDGDAVRTFPFGSGNQKTNNNNNGSSSNSFTDVSDAGDSAENIDAPSSSDSPASISRINRHIHAHHHADHTNNNNSNILSSSNTEKEDEESPVNDISEFPLLTELLEEEYENAIKNKNNKDDPNAPTSIIIGFPLECNFSGARVPLATATKIIQECEERFGDVLDIHFVLDGAAASSKVPIRLDGSDADALCCSLYKMAGLPFGVGALLVKKSLIERNSEQRLLHDGRSFFGGGTVEALAMSSEFVSLHPGAHAWEDGTPNISALQLVPAALRQVGLAEHSINAVSEGLSFKKNDIWENITQSAIKREKLRRRLKFGLQALKHHNGMNVVHILDSYFADANGARRASDEEGTAEELWWPFQGGVVSFVLRTDTGLPVGHQLVERLALAHGICLRTGCFCNTGSCQVFLGLSDKSLRQYLREGHICGGPVDIVDDGMRPRGAVRLSLGWTSTEAEIDEIIAWARACFVFSAPPSSDDAIKKNTNNNSTTAIASSSSDSQAAATVAAIETHGSEEARDAVEALALSKQRRARVKRMWVYPVKGLNGTECASWRLDRNNGSLLLDRRYAIVDRLTGQPVQPKQNQRLSYIDATLRLKEGVMILRATTRDFEPLVIALPSDVTADPTQIEGCVQTAGHAVSTLTKMQLRVKQSAKEVHRPVKEYESKVNIRGHSIGTQMMSFDEDVDVWLSAVLMQGVKLIMTTTEKKTSDSASFANKDHSLLLISSNSHDEVERNTPEDLKRQLDVRKYRANLYVDVLYNAESTVSLQHKKTNFMFSTHHQRQSSLQNHHNSSNNRGSTDDLSITPRVATPLGNLDGAVMNNNNNGGEAKTILPEELPVFPEQNWSKIIAPFAQFTSVGTCHRCEQIGVDPNTGRVQPQPLAALVTIAGARAGAAALKNNDNNNTNNAPILDEKVGSHGSNIPSHLRDGIAKSRGGVGSAPTLGQLFTGVATAPRSDVLKSLEAAVKLLGSSSSTKKGNKSATTTNNNNTSIVKKQSSSRLIDTLSSSVSSQVNAGAYSNQVLLSMFAAAIGTFLYARQNQHQFSYSLITRLESLVNDIFRSNVLQFNSSPKIISLILSLVSSVVVALVEVRLLRRLGCIEDNSKKSSESEAATSIMDKMMSRHPGSIAVGDILIVESN